ncbi:hypothetical protein NN561_001487 [Cricetulus griseus]
MADLGGGDLGRECFSSGGGVGAGPRASLTGALALGPTHLVLALGQAHLVLVAWPQPRGSVPGGTGRGREPCRGAGLGGPGSSAAPVSLALEAAPRSQLLDKQYRCSPSSSSPSRRRPRCILQPLAEPWPCPAQSPPRCPQRGRGHAEAFRAGLSR